MTPRCKPGDIAVVLYDVPPCVINIGRLVEVSGPMQVNPTYGPSWLIRPLRPEPWMVETSGGFRLEVISSFKAKVEHADRWLLPVGHRRPEAKTSAPRAKRTSRGGSAALPMSRSPLTLSINSALVCQQVIGFQHPRSSIQEDRGPDFLAPHDFAPALLDIRWQT